MVKMDRKQKEALILSLAERGKSYRENTKEAGVSSNTIKAILNKAGLDQTTSISSRVFELYSLEFQLSRILEYSKNELIKN